ncbi:hypothetical protein HDU98_000719 [Podochytrium sp. JEL0797]|nr:hypothetical protein HDU98_000719 [Podochytrium sp. JEL0797]
MDPEFSHPPVASADENTSRLLQSLQHHGLSAGAFSDTTLVILGREYNLHLAVLYTNAFFKAAIQGSLATAAGVTVPRYSKNLRKGSTAGSLPHAKHVLHIEAGEGVTIEGVEMILDRLYGRFGQQVTEETFQTILPAAYFFRDENLCDQCALFIRQINHSPSRILEYFTFASKFDFGPYSELLLRNCLIYLCKEGTTNPALNSVNVYSKLDYCWLATIVCSDVFYVKSEADRFLFLMEAVKARDGGKEVGRIKNFLSGSFFSDNFSSSGRGKVVVIESALEEEESVVPLTGEVLAHEVDEMNDLDGEDDSDVEVPAVPRRERMNTFDSKRVSVLAEILEDEEAPEPLSISTLFKGTPPTAVPSSLFQDRFVSESPTLSNSFDRLPAPISTIRINTLVHKKSFKQRRDSTRFYGDTSNLNNTANAIEVLSNGVIFTHMNEATLSKLKAEGLISPLVLGLQHKVSIDLQNRIKKSNPKTVSLGIKYVADRVGVSEQIRKDLEGSVGPATALPPPCFYDWIFLDPFRHKLSEVQPFRFADEFSLAKVVGSKSKLYSKPVPYAGSLWYLMVRNESDKTVGRLGVYIYRKQDKKLSGYSDHRNPVQFWGRVCAYVHNPRNSVIDEPFAFEVISQAAQGSDAKFVGDVNRICGEDLMAEAKSVEKADLEGSVVRCSVVLALF